MDFSQFSDLFTLRQQLLTNLRSAGPIRTPASTTLRNRVVQELRRTSTAAAAEKPDQAAFVKNILHAAAAPLSSVGSKSPLPVIKTPRKSAAPKVKMKKKTTK